MGRSDSSNKGGRGKWIPDSGGSKNKNSKKDKEDSSPNMSSKKKGLVLYSPLFVNSEGRVQVDTSSGGGKKQTPQKSKNNNFKVSAFKNSNNFTNSRKTKLSQQPKKKQQQQMKKTCKNNGPGSSVGGGSTAASKKRKRDDSLDNHRSNLQLPSKHAGKQVHNIPWMQGLLSTDTAAGGANSSPARRTNAVRLPTDDVDRTWLNRLDNEIVAFADYVRLTPMELSARQGMVRELTDLTQDISFTTSQGTRTNYDEKVSFQPFGSFAAPLVCTFHSDVDLALWGVVPDVLRPKQPPLPKESSIQSLEVAADVAKRKRLSRWLNALAALDEENLCSPGAASTIAGGDINDSQHDEGGIRGRQGSQLDLLAAKDAENNASRGSHVASKQTIHDPEVIDLTTPTRSPQKRPSVVDLSNYTSPEPPGEKNCQLGEKVEQAAAGHGEVENEMPLFVVDRQGDDVGPLGSFASKADDETSIGNAVDPESNSNEDNYGAVASNGSDNDSADKLEGLERNKRAVTDTKKSLLEDQEQVVVSLESSDNNEDLEFIAEGGDGSEGDECDYIGEFGPDEDDEAEDDFLQKMEVGFIDSGDRGLGATSTMAEVVPEVRRKDALDALNRLNRQLRRSRMASSINFIRRARVPIIKFMSKLGVEVDISIGGTNGADTSLYAARQSARYNSFAPVVLTLKIIMGQQALDTPFNGGLGSFKLYVLMAHHIQKHISLGGSDRPGEILLSFLFRYGGRATGDHCVHKQSKTVLAQDSEIKCEDGFTADMSNVFKVEECCTLFGSVWKRLWARVRRTEQDQHPRSISSLLAELIHVDRLARERQESAKKAERFVGGVVPNPYEAATSKENPTPRQTTQSQVPGDRSAAQLAAGYGVKLSLTHKRPAKRMRSS